MSAPTNDSPRLPKTTQVGYLAPFPAVKAPTQDQPAERSPDTDCRSGAATRTPVLREWVFPFSETDSIELGHTPNRQEDQTAAQVETLAPFPAAVKASTQDQPAERSPDTDCRSGAATRIPVLSTKNDATVSLPPDTATSPPQSVCATAADQVTTERPGRNYTTTPQQASVAAAKQQQQQQQHRQKHRHPEETAVSEPTNDSPCLPKTTQVGFLAPFPAFTASTQDQLAERSPDTDRQEKNDSTASPPPPASTPPAQSTCADRVESALPPSEAATSQSPAHSQNTTAQTISRQPLDQQHTSNSDARTLPPKSQALAELLPQLVESGVVAKFFSKRTPTESTMLLVWSQYKHASPASMERFHSLIAALSITAPCADECDIKRGARLANDSSTQCSTDNTAPEHTPNCPTVVQVDTLAPSPKAATATTQDQPPRTGEVSTTHTEQPNTQNNKPQGHRDALEQPKANLDNADEQQPNATTDDDSSDTESFGSDTAANSVAEEALDHLLQWFPEELLDAVELAAFNHDLDRVRYLIAAHETQCKSANDAGFKSWCLSLAALTGLYNNPAARPHEWSAFEAQTAEASKRMAKARARKTESDIAPDDEPDADTDMQSAQPLVMQQSSLPPAENPKSGAVGPSRERGE